MEGRTVSHYEVMDRLGRGGMGVVYRAKDLKLDRVVALKFLPVDLGDNPEMRERFLREAKAASALDNSRICTVFEIGETDDGQQFIAMAYCPGETLKQRIQRGPVPFDQARAIAIQIAEGLAAAHDAGIVHRDIKPANIILSPGGVKILDFGLAKLSDVTHLTQTGATMGTPAYMSPEQATGGDIDARSDIWSLGAILYEMVTGARAFKGDNATAIMFAILSQELQPVSELRKDVPEELELVTARCLERDPEKRYSNLREMLADLGVEGSLSLVTGAGYDAEKTAISGEPGVRRRGGRSGAARWRIAAAAVALVILGGTGWWWIARSSAPGRVGSSVEERVAETAPDRVVGVVNFVNRTGDPEYDWFGEGLARLVSDSLAGSRMLQVMSGPRIEAALHAEAGTGVTESAARQGIDALVTGEILIGEGGVSVSARVADTATGESLAARRVDSLSPTSLLSCADELSAEVRRGLGLPPEDSVDIYAVDFFADNPEAFRLYLDGLRAFTNWDYEEAEKYFLESLALAPDFTMARYRLAWVLAATGRRDEAMTEIGRAASESAGLSDREARYVRAARAEFESRLDDALAEYRELVDRYPYDGDARHLLAGILHDTGQYEQEIDELHLLAELDPNDTVVQSMLGYAYLARGDYTGAVVAFQRYVEIEPGSANGHHSLGDAYRAQGELDLAAEEYQKAREADPQFHLATTSLAVVEAIQGRSRHAETILEELIANREAPPQDRIEAAFDLASLLRSRGRFREAESALARMAGEIEAEQVREAMALSVRGACLAEIGEVRAARRLLDEAIDHSPGVPTRYLFAKGVFELGRRDTAAVRDTAAEIERGALPADDPDRTENKAAAYLRGMASLAEGAAEEALRELILAVTLEGYEYSIYRLGLARAYLEAGRLPEAMAAARQASEQLDPADPRLDLELDRRRAGLILAEIHDAMGRPDKAASGASDFLAVWRNSDAGPPDVATAKKLAGDPG